MLTGLVNRLRGQVRVRAECAFPERVLNLCGAQDLAFWDLEWESPTAFTCRLSRRDWKRLREAGKKLDCTFSLVGLEGAPYFLLRFRHRQALLIGLLGCALTLFLGSFFIWDFQVEGNETVPTERILRALEKNGVTLGTFGLSLDGEDIRNHMLLDVPELIWVAVNVSGCRAEIQVRERTPAPVMIDRREPCNLVARRAGLVKRVQTIGG
ncbi:MAG: sporulation protein YqfD, partial [Muribaculaceae bacterium]|nr:sporulation protein YqfD [Muribaculaceae bacterium]